MVRLTVLYGSQTGNSEDVAEHIGHEARRRLLTTAVSAFDEFDIRFLLHHRMLITAGRGLLDQTFVVFICSTTGQGEEPDNMKKSWKFLLKKSLPSDSLASINFAVFAARHSSLVSPQRRCLGWAIRRIQSTTLLPRSCSSD